MTYNRQRPFVYGRVGTIIKNLQKMIFGVGSYTQLLPFLKDKIDYANEVGDGTNSDVVMAPVQWMMRTFPEAPIRMRTYDKDGEEEMIVDHKLLDLLSNPNESYPSETLWASTILSYAVDGNAYWLKVYSNSGKVVQLWWVPHTLISPVQPWELRDDESQFINYYRYTVPGRGDYYIEPDGVVHFRFGQDIENPRKGLSPLKSAVREIFSDQEAANWTAALLKNGAVPGLMVAPDPAGGGGRVGDAALKATKTYLESQFTASNRGRPHVSSMPMKIEQFGFSPEQMDLKVVRRLPEERVSALLGIPAIVAGLGAGLDRSTFSNMGEAREMAWESNVIPTQRIFAATISMQLLRKDFMQKEGGTPGRGNKRAPTEIYFDNSDVRVLQEDENNKVTRLNTGVKGGWIRVSEARREQNLMTNEFDEVYLRNPAMIEVMADEPRPEPEPEVVEVEKPAPKKDSPPDADKADGGNKWREDYEKFQGFLRLTVDETELKDVLRRVDAKLGDVTEEMYNEAIERIKAELGIKPEVGQEAAQEGGLKAQEAGGEVDGVDEGNPQGGSGGDERGGGSLETPSESHSPENKKVGTRDSLELLVRTSTSADENTGDGAGDDKGSGRNGGVGNKGNSEHGDGGTKGGGIDGAGLEQHDQGRAALSSSGDRASHVETDSGVLSGAVAGSDENFGNKNGNVGRTDDDASKQGGRDNRHGTKGKGGDIDGAGKGQGDDGGGGGGGEDSGRGGDKHVEASSGNSEGLKDSTSAIGGELDGDSNSHAKKASDRDSGADNGETKKDHSRDFGNLDHEVKERTDDSRTIEGHDAESNGRGNKGIAKADADGHDEVADSGDDRGDWVSNRENRTGEEKRKQPARGGEHGDDSEREERVAGIPGLIGSRGLNGGNESLDERSDTSGGLAELDDARNTIGNNSSNRGSLGGTKAMGTSEPSDIDATEAKGAQRDDSTEGLRREEIGESGSGDAESSEQNDLSGAMQDTVRSAGVDAQASNGEDGHRRNDSGVGESTGESINAGLKADQQGKGRDTGPDNGVVRSGTGDGLVSGEGGPGGTGKAEGDSGDGSKRSGEDNDAESSGLHADSRDGGEDNEGGAGYSGSVSSGWRSSGGIDAKHSDAGEEPDDRDGEGIRGEEPTEDVRDTSEGTDNDNDIDGEEIRPDGVRELRRVQHSVSVGSDAVEQDGGGDDNSDLSSDMGEGGVKDDSVFERSGESAGQGILQDEIREVDGQLKSTEENDKSDDQIREVSGTKEVAERIEGDYLGGKRSVDDENNESSNRTSDEGYKQELRIHIGDGSMGVDNGVTDGNNDGQGDFDPDNDNPDGEGTKRSNDPEDDNGPQGTSGSSVGVSEGSDGSYQSGDYRKASEERENVSKQGLEDTRVGHQGSDKETISVSEGHSNLESKKKDDLEFKQQTKIQQDLINNLNAAIPTLSGDMQEALLKKFGELGDISANTFLRNSSLILTSDQDGNFSFAPDKLGDAIEQIDASKWAKNELEPIYKRQNRRVLDHTTESVGTIMNIVINVPDRVARELINTGGTRLGLLDVASDTRKAIFRSLDEGRKLGEGADALARRIRNEVPKGRFLNAGSTYRARMIARTETKWSQNESSLVAYDLSPDITEVVAFDAQLGPDRSDPECISRNGRTFTIKQARSEMGREHPNGTLSFAPIVRSGAPRREAAGSRGTDGPFGPVTENQPIASSRPGAQRRGNRTLNLPDRSSFQGPPKSGAEARARVASIGDDIKPVLDDIQQEYNLVNAEYQELQDVYWAINNKDFPSKEEYQKAFDSLLDQLRDKQAEVNKIADEYRTINEITNDFILDVIGHGEGGAKPQWEISQKLSEVRDVFGRTGEYASEVVSFDDISYIDRASDRFRRMVKDWPDQEKQLDFGIVPGRAYAQSTGGGNTFISIEGIDGSLGTIVHEMGHALEHANIDILRESMEFVYQRTKNEKARRLRDIYKGAGYDKREIARIDEFIDAYIGKDYSLDLKILNKHFGKNFDKDYWGYIESPYDKNKYVGGGELVSMGLEVMSENPIWFANTDAGHFDFIFERVMHRGLINR